MTEYKDIPEFLKEGDGYVDITLAKPAGISGSLVTTVRMREPEVGDLEAHQDSRDKDATREVILFAHLCEIPPEDIRRMKLRNYARLQAGFSLFTT